MMHTGIITRSAFFELAWEGSVTPPTKCFTCIAFFELAWEGSVMQLY